jgi:glycosyltransferase involved in cell wall biosynthesis
MVMCVDKRSPGHGMIARVNPKIAILLCTKDGAAFLSEQLQSFADQTHKNWILFASDDGSLDETHDLLARFAEQYDRHVAIREGPRQGARANFLSLALDPTIEADYFAYSDQDDIWYAYKFERALEWLATIPDNVPALYCGRTELIRIDGQSCGLSPLFVSPPSFRNALVQNIAGGNTMIFNRAAKKLLESAEALDVAAHDWWTYQVISAVGGAVRYDPQPTIKYRQHPSNLVGSNLGWKARMARVRMMTKGRFIHWNEANISALRRISSSLMRSDNRMIVEEFAKARSGRILNRLYYFWKSGVYRQTFLGNLGLLAAVLLKRI